VISRRRLLKAAAGLSLWPLQREPYAPPSELDGGWRVGDATALGVDPRKLADAVQYHDDSPFTKSHGGAVVIVHKGHIIGES